MEKMLYPRKALIAIFLVFVALAFLASACGGGANDDKKSPGLFEKKQMKDQKEKQEKASKEEAEAASAPAPTPAPAPEKMEIAKTGTLSSEPYSYDPINKIDPFAQYDLTVELPTAGGKEENVLTKYEIRYFRLVGVIADESQPRAIFEDPRQHSYVVTVGTPIGRNLGVIEQILPDSVIVSEQRFVPGGPNELETVQLVIKLHPDREKESQGGGG